MTDFKIIAESNADEFIQYLNQVEHGFVYMIQTMMDVAQVVKENTIPMTPFLYGYLSGSFKPIVLADNSRMKIVQLRMSAINQETGYNYALIQHENTRYKHGNNRSYNYKDPNSGRFNWTENIQLNNITGGLWSNVATDHFLLKGIRDSTEDAFMLIEEDYLSLFKGGYIY